MTLGEAKARTDKTFIVQASLMISTNDCDNIFIVEAAGVRTANLLQCFWMKCVSGAAQIG